MLLFNGTPLEDRKLVLDCASPWLRFGDAAFETIRVEGGRPMWWAHHRARLEAAVEASGLAASGLGDRASADVLRCIEMSGCLLGALRIYAVAADEAGTNVDVVTMIEPWSPPVELYSRGLVLGLTDVPHPRDGAFGKSAARRWSRVARRTAPPGVDDVVFVIEGACAETATASLLWLRGGAWFTAPESLGALHSTTLAALESTGLAIGRERLDPHALDDIEAMVAISSLRLAVGVRQFVAFESAAPDKHAAPLRERLLASAL